MNWALRCFGLKWIESVSSLTKQVYSRGKREEATGLENRKDNKVDSDIICPWAFSFGQKSRRGLLQWRRRRREKKGAGQGEEKEEETFTFFLDQTSFLYEEVASAQRSDISRGNWVLLILGVELCPHLGNCGIPRWRQPAINQMANLSFFRFASAISSFLSVRRGIHYHIKLIWSNQRQKSEYQEWIKQLLWMRVVTLKAFTRGWKKPRKINAPSWKGVSIQHLFARVTTENLQRKSFTIHPCHSPADPNDKHSSYVIQQQICFERKEKRRERSRQKKGHFLFLGIYTSHWHTKLRR